MNSVLDGLRVRGLTVLCNFLMLKIISFIYFFWGRKYYHIFKYFSNNRVEYSNVCVSGHS